MHAVSCITSIYCNINSKGDLVVDEYIIKKQGLATYTAEIKNNVFKSLPKQNKLEEAEASLKKTVWKDWNWKNVYLNYHFWGHA